MQGADQRTFGGSDFVVMGGPKNNRISGLVVRDLQTRLNIDPGQDMTSNDLRQVVEKTVPRIDQNLPRITKFAGEDGHRRSWAVVMRCANPFNKDRWVLLGAGETGEGTYASFCQEAQKELSIVLREKGISGEFLAVFEVKVGEHPTRKSPHLVKEIRLLHVACPALRGYLPYEPPSSDEEGWRIVGPFRPWSVLLVAASPANSQSMIDEFKEHKHRVNVVETWDKAEATWNLQPPDLVVVEEAMFVERSVGAEDAISQKAERAIWSMRNEARLCTPVVGIFPDAAEENAIRSSRWRRVIDAGLRENANPAHERPLPAVKCLLMAIDACLESRNVEEFRDLLEFVRFGDSAV